MTSKLSIKFDFQQPNWGCFDIQVYYPETKFLLACKSLQGPSLVPHMFTHMPDNFQVVSLPVTLTGDKNV